MYPWSLAFGGSWTNNLLLARLVCWSDRATSCLKTGGGSVNACICCPWGVVGTSMLYDKPTSIRLGNQFFVQSGDTMSSHRKWSQISRANWSQDDENSVAVLRPKTPESFPKTLQSQRMYKCASTDKANSQQNTFVLIEPSASTLHPICL